MPMDATVRQTRAFRYEADRFADIQILRYQVPGFEALNPVRKQLVYYLYEAALSGRDIIWDQNNRHNLLVRHTLEAMVRHYPGERDTEAFRHFMVYVKRVWFANGIHHHYSTHKLEPDMDFATFADLFRATPAEYLPLLEGQTPKQLLSLLERVIFDANYHAKKVAKDPNRDLVRHSAVNFYEGVSEAEVTAYYRRLRNPDNPCPPSHGLNSKLVKHAGEVRERVWKVGGLYTQAIERIVFWLKKAIPLAETPAQQEALTRLVRFYETGDLEEFDRHCVAWVRDTDSVVDTINGFIEVYNDPLGYRGSYEALVSLCDPQATRRIETIAANAQWFEDHAPIMPEHKKTAVKGITGTVINVVVEAGDSSPATPIGINLPNAEWIREQHGSKSVNLANIVTALNQAQDKLRVEFTLAEEEIERGRRYSELADNLHTDMHEVIGHASGKVNPGVGTPKETLKNYGSTIEEARADLVALYYLMDPKLVELGLMPSLDVGRTQYDGFIRNGLMVQLRRVKSGEDLEEDHMRNRQLIAKWVYEKSSDEGVIEKVRRDGKTFFTIRDHARLRDWFGLLLREIQRIKSEGDLEAARELVETYGVTVDRGLHDEVLARFARLDMAAFHGFINPRLTPVYQGEELVDVRIAFPDDFQAQMLEYADRYAFLPTRP